MMKILSVEKYKGSTWRIDFENLEPAFLNSEIISKYNLRAGAEIPGDAWEEIVYSNDLRRARERAMYLLDYRDYSYSDPFHSQFLSSIIVFFPVIRIILA